MIARSSLNRPLVVILVTITLDSIGLGLVIPVLPDLIREVTHVADVARHFGWFLSAYALMQFLFSPVLGALSDRYGRRPVLLASLAGATVDYLIMATAPSLSLLYVGRIVAGISGANMAVATAYLTDVSAEDQRARRFGYMNACYSVGFIAGPMIGGVVGAYSPRYPFVAAAAFNGVNLLLAWFVLPESHRAERKPLRISHMNPLQSLRWVFGVKGLLPLLAVYTIVCCVGQVPMTIWVIYGEDRFAWGVRMVGLTFTVFGVMHGLAQAFLTGWLTSRWGERRSLLLALASDNLGYVAMAVVTRGWIVFPIMSLMAVGGIAMPMLQALASRQVDEDRQGELQGTLVSVMSLASVVGPVAVTSIYASTAAAWPGFVWVCGAVVYLLCVPALWFDGIAAPAEGGAASPAA